MNDNVSDKMKLKRQRRIHHNQKKKDSRRIVAVELISCGEMRGRDERGHEWKISLHGTDFGKGSATNVSVARSIQQRFRNWYTSPMYAGGHVHQTGIIPVVSYDGEHGEILDRGFSIYGIKKNWFRSRRCAWNDWTSSIPPKYRMFRHKEKRLSEKGIVDE